MWLPKWVRTNKLTLDQQASELCVAMVGEVNYNELCEKVARLKMLVGMTNDADELINFVT